ncbi:MAG: DNA helicase, partial [Thiomargarita sp.]|nr:DNA helicase [Thiomargarita sp.]
MIIGNPPYNAGQANENDNNKNRKYKTIDGRVKETYSKDSKATLRKALSDPYVKAIRWASDRIEDEGIVALVTNNSFLEGLSFDGMRKHLEQDFSSVYVLDLGGNIRKNPGKTSNVFNIMVGVSINFFVKSSAKKGIFYTDVGDALKKQDKLDYLSKNTLDSIQWKLIQPDQKKTWLTDGLQPEFDDFLPLGTKEAKGAKTEVDGVIFKTYSNGVKTNRDAWVYNFNQNILAGNMQCCIDTYNNQVEKWVDRNDMEAKIDDFVLYDDRRISWSRDLKLKLKRKKFIKFDKKEIRISLYRPFIKSNLSFNFGMVDVPGQFPKIFPTQTTENMVICCTNYSQIPFVLQIMNCIPDVNVGGRPSQCFPLYTYTEDGSRTENITNW